MEFSFKLLVQTDTNDINIENNKVDVEVIFSDEKRYVATFITLNHIQTLFDKNTLTGEYKSGLYFPCPNIIILKKLTESAIHEIIENLLKEKEFKNVFSKVN